MSLSSIIDRVTYSGNGATTAFAFGYMFFDQSDLVVVKKNNTTGVETTQTITTHYTISGTQTNGVYLTGGTVTFLTAPASGETVIIYRDRSATQDLDLDENGKIPSDNLEKQMDKLTAYIQRVKNKLARSVGLKEGFTASFDPTLPGLMTNKGYIRTKSDGSGLEYIAETDLINTISTGSQVFTASRALASDSNGLATVSATTDTELGYVSGVTSAIQTQLNAKQATITGGATTVISSDLTADRALVSNGSGKIAVSSITATVLGYLSGVTSAIQTQLDGKEPSFATLPISKGGTNNGSLGVTAGGVLYTDGSKVVNVGAGTAGQLLKSNGSSAPSWQSRAYTAGAQISSTGVVSNESDDFINGNASVSTSTFTITLNTFFSAIHSVNVTIIGDATMNLGVCAVNSVSTSSIVVSFSTPGSGNTARPFHISVTGTLV